MLHRLDRYVARNVLGSYAATLLFVAFLWTVFDMLLNMGGYLDSAEKRGLSLVELLWTWARVQLVSLPLLFVLVAPFATVIACMFAISRIMSTNEVVPMVFTGRSTMRVLLPALLTGLLSGLAMAGVWQFVLPELSRSIEMGADQLDDPDEAARQTPLLLRSRDGQQRLICSGYDPGLQRMEEPYLVDMGAGRQDRALVVASAGLWNPERGLWELVGGERRAGDVRTPWPDLALDWVDPDTLRLAGKDAKESSLLSYTELLELIALSPGRDDLVIAFHYHLTWPLANVVLLLLALPFAVHFERGSKTGRVVLAIVICGAYLLADLTFQNLGRNEFLHPVVSAWAPMILFSSLGVVMFASMRS